MSYFIDRFVLDSGKTIMGVYSDDLLNGVDGFYPPQSKERVEAAVYLLTKTSALATVKTKHASAILLLTDETTPEERDTWPVKVIYAEKLAAGTLSDTERKMIEDALVDGETVESYLAVVAAKTLAFAQLAFFAEGFKRKTNSAIEVAETVEQINAVLNAASVDMDAAITAFKSQL